MGWEFCIYSVTYFKNNLFAPDDCGSYFSFHRPRRSATILYWRPGMDRWLDERLHSMQPQIVVVWIKERLCGLRRGCVIWREVFNIRRDWETWREVAKQKESSKIHTCGEKLGCKTWDGVRDSIHEFYDRLCSLDLFICLKQGWPEFVSFFILYLLDPVAMHWCVQSFSAAYISESFTTRGVALCLSSIM